VASSNPGTPRLLRGINDRAALTLLLEHGQLSRSRLGELTGLSKPTTSQLLARLETSGLVRHSGNSTGRPGPKAQLYEVVPHLAHVAALDVTPARILSAVADLTGRIVGEFELRTPRRAGADTVARVCEAVDGALGEAKLNRSALQRLVIGTPGAFDPRTRQLRYARHLPGWHDPQLLGRLAETLDVPLDVDNDVNLAAVAEQHDGRARGTSNFVLLWGEEGLGAAIVIDGTLHRGFTGGAGEVGFLPLPETPLVRDVGRTNAGGFQELAGGKPVLELARQLGLRAGSPEAAVQRALTTPGAGDELLRTLGHRVALGLAAIVSVIDPELVVLTGGVLQAGGERLLELVRTELAGLSVARPSIELSGVPDKPVLQGALHVGLARTRDEVFDTIQATRPAAGDQPHASST
jgi:predicted NBD/HSP70 family sugar kinase